MGKSGIVTTENTDSELYHDVMALFKIYRSVSWKMQIQIGQVKHRFQKEYGTDVDEFLESLHQAGMDLNDDEANIRSRVEAISSSNKFLKLIDESHKYHPQGERNYLILYYTYMSPYQLMNITEIISKLEPHLPQSIRD